MKTNLKLIPTKYRGKFNVRLILGTESRHIGILDIQGKTFFTSRKPNHLFRESNSIGLNEALLTDKSIPFQWIVVDYLDARRTNHKLVTSRNYFIEHGKCLHFSKQSFELQRFLELSKFGIDKARDFERQKAIQEKLFSEVA